ncbi:MAG: hypothetical protein V7K32_06580 [Nostoc sp.]
MRNNSRVARCGSISGLVNNPLSRIGKTNLALRGCVLSIQYLQNLTPRH